MYSNAKHQYRRSQANESGFTYVNDAKEYTSFPSSISLNFEDGENMIKKSKHFQQDINELRNPRCDYYNDEKSQDESDIPSKNTLFPNRAQTHSYHLYGHYHQQQKQDHQGRHSQRNHLQNHNNHQHYYSNSNYCDNAYNNIVMPPSSVHIKPFNGNHFCNNNDNNYCKKSTQQLSRENYHHQTLPTADCLQFKSSDLTSSNSVSERNSQHYYSKFYNQTNCSWRGRKLPTAHKMPLSKQITYSTEIQLNTSLISVVNGITNNVNDNKTNPKKNINFVLKEKSVNNNDLVAFENGNSEYDADYIKQFKGDGGDFLDLKSYEFLECKNSQTCDGMESKAALLYLQKHKSRTSSANIWENFYCNNQLPKDEKLSEGNSLKELYIYEETTRHQILNKKKESYSKNIKLPTTPTKTKAGSAKKGSPPAKNRRVLIYSIQSPRLSRLSTSNIRLQKSKLKHCNETKECNKNPVTNEALCLDNDVLDQVSVFDSPSHIKNLRKIACDESKKKNEYRSQFKEKYVDSNDDDDDDDDLDDDDFDNVSNFDSSSDSDIFSDSEEGYRSYAYKITHSLDIIATSLSLEASVSETNTLETPDALLVPSLFPNVPPYIAFSSNVKKGPEVPSDLYRILKWRVTNVMPRVVRSILANSGMRLLKKTNEWMGVWGKHMKSPCFKTIRPYQKINHLPGSFKIGRKDSCWKNLVKLMAKHGKRDFGFMPKTYIMPNDLKQLRKNWPKYSQKNVKWIIKPPASARGTGIRVVDRWAQIPKRKPLIVQKYIERPLLINGSKFDLRLYVLVTSINPLRVYMYHNGLARFASVKYSDKSDTLNDRCMHLTNYSINKFSSNYSKNEDVNACHGHKWSIKSLWIYLRSRGVRTDLLWAALRSLVLRTILAGENSINNMIRANVESKYSCFELFGFDVLLDADLVPWLLEVNISPSLHSELPLDLCVKAPLVQSVLNTALYNIPPKIPIERQMEIAMEMSIPPGPICYDKRMYISYLSRKEKNKHNLFTRKSMEEREEYVKTILEHLTPDDVRCLVIAEDELARCSPLERIFPTVDTYKYLKYTEVPRYYNRLLDGWETRYANNRTEGIHLLRQYCEDGYHLQIPQIQTKKDFLAKFLRWILKS